MEVDFEIVMPEELPAGTTVFRVTNDGATVHNFQIANEEINNVFATNLQPGETRTMVVDLQPGTYRVWCPVDNHAQLGMDMELTVVPEGTTTPTGGTTTPNIQGATTPPAQGETTPPAPAY